MNFNYVCAIIWLIGGVLNALSGSFIGFIGYFVSSVFFALLSSGILVFSQNITNVIDKK